MTRNAWVFVSLAVTVGSWSVPASADAQTAESAASESDETEYAYPSDEYLLWWMEEVIRPEREKAYAEELAAEEAARQRLGESTRTTTCTNEPYSDNWIVGTTGDDVLIYGRILTGAYPFYTIYGTGVCRYSYSAGATCHIGTFQNKTMWFYETDYPLGIMGDPSGGAYGEDYIVPADGCSASPIAGGCSGGTNYWGSAGLRSATTFHICGDDCSVASGDKDLISGWDNRDLLMGCGSGDGIDYISGGAFYGTDQTDDTGSDCIWGDNGSDWAVGAGCSVAAAEYIWGGLGNDDLYA